MLCKVHLVTCPRTGPSVPWVSGSSQRQFVRVSCAVVVVVCLCVALRAHVGLSGIGSGSCQKKKRQKQNQKKIIIKMTKIKNERNKKKNQRKKRSLKGVHLGHASRCCSTCLLPENTSIHLASRRRHCRPAKRNPFLNFRQRAIQLFQSCFQDLQALEHLRGSTCTHTIRLSHDPSDQQAKPTRNCSATMTHT